MSKLSLGVQKAAQSRGEIVARPDVAIGTVIDLRIPDSIPVLTGVLDSLGGAIAKGGWWTAAAVYAWTEPGEPHFASGEKSSDGRLTLSAFAELEIRGLSSRDSVRKYRGAWEAAIVDGPEAKHVCGWARVDGLWTCVGDHYAEGMAEQESTACGTTLPQFP